MEEEKLLNLAKEVIKLAQDDILIHLRFFDMAVFRLTWEPRESAVLPQTNQRQIFYQPRQLLKNYKKEPASLFRTYLHIILHCVFSHSYGYGTVDSKLWDMAADIAVENAILEMGLPQSQLEQDIHAKRKLTLLKEDISALTADRIYRYLLHNPISNEEWQEWILLFQKDDHALWREEEKLEISLEQWKKISERVKADLKSFTKAKAGAETLEKNLEEATREDYDYEAILKRFTVMGEDMGINDEEFDYIYYTYGLTTYGNLPLIEPLEYKEVHKVREFVIAIDTSASCRGEIVREFLNHTYTILKSTETYFHKVNIHILQCDNEVREDVKITSDEEFHNFMRYGKIKGFGATDFRPVFDYVDKLMEQGEFENLKGLIYFTDGYGVYPEKMPRYETIFAFLEEDENRQPVPPWSLKVILKEKDYEYKTSQRIH